MTAEVSRTAVSLVVDDTPIHPPVLSPAEIESKRYPCRVTVTLRGVYYSGDDLGSRWVYQVSADGGVWYSGPITHHWRTWYTVGRELLNEVREHGCDTTQLVHFFIRARKRNWGIFDDIGQRFDMTALPCVKEGSRRSVVILVPVPQYFATFWRWLFRMHRRVALLFFFLDVEAQCVG